MEEKKRKSSPFKVGRFKKKKKNTCQLSKIKLSLKLVIYITKVLQIPESKYLNFMIWSQQRSLDDPPPHTHTIG